MERIGIERLTKEVCTSDVEGKRRRGRPRLRGRDKLREYMEEGGMTLEEGF